MCVCVRERESVCMYVSVCMCMCVYLSVRPADELSFGGKALHLAARLNLISNGSMYIYMPLYMCRASYVYQYR